MPIATPPRSTPAPRRGTRVSRSPPDPAYGELRRRVARYRKMQVFALDAVAVVGDADALDAAAGEIDVDLGCACIERILEQLLQRGGGTLDDLAGGDLVDQLIGECADRGHRDQLTRRDAQRV